MAGKKAVDKKKSKAKPDKDKAPPTRKPTDLSKVRGDVAAIVRQVNKDLGGDVIRLGSEMETDYLLRRPTGITSLDIELAGGFPAASTNVLVGPDGSGKDYLLWRTCAEVQKVYGDDFCMIAYLTEFRADKPFMRNVCGLKIAFSDEELAHYDEARSNSGQPALTDEEKAEMKTQVGQIFLIDGVTAEKGFDAIMSMVAANVCQIVAVNSIGSLQTEAKEEQESFETFARQSSEATLISKFVPKLAMTLNNDEHGRNETTLIIINQVRSKRDAAPVRGRPVMESDKYEAGSKAWALKHGKAIEIELHKGAPHRDAVDNTILGRKVKWKISKGKLGTHDGLNGEYDFFYDGGVDLIGDLYNCCIRYGVFDQAGAWIEFEHEEFGFRAQGKDQARRKMMENEELRSILRAECFRRAGVVYTYRR